MEGANQNSCFSHQIVKSQLTYLGVLPGETKRHAIYRLSGYTYKQIQIVVGVSPNAISEVVAQVRNTGEFIEQPTAKIGRPQKITQEIIQAISNMTEENPRRPGRIIADLLGISVASVNNIRNDIGFQYLPPKKKPHLTLEQIQKRVLFGYSLYKCSIDFNALLFSDESKMSLFPDNRSLWRKRGSQNDNIYLPQKKFYNSIMVFGIIGKNYKSKLVISNTSIDSEQYCYNLMKSGVLELNFDSNSKIFQQDGAPAHTSSLALSWLEKRMNVLNH